MQRPRSKLLEAPVGDVLTLAEAAAYLRLPESEVARLVHTQGLPGGAVGEEWRFLKTALQDWSADAVRPTAQRRGCSPYDRALYKDRDLISINAQGDI